MARCRHDPPWAPRISMCSANKKVQQKHRDAPVHFTMEYKSDTLLIPLGILLCLLSHLALHKTHTHIHRWAQAWGSQLRVRQNPASLELLSSGIQTHNPPLPGSVQPHIMQNNTEPGSSRPMKLTNYFAQAISSKWEKNTLFCHIPERRIIQLQMDAPLSKSESFCYFPEARQCKLNAS